MVDWSRKEMLPVLGIGLMLLIAQDGCGTIEGLSRPEGQSLVIIGTRRDIEHITGKRHSGNSCMDLTEVFLPCYVLDLPISFGLDVAFLPITLICELVSRPRSTGETELPDEKVKLREEKK